MQILRKWCLASILFFSVSITFSAAQALPQVPPRSPIKALTLNETFKLALLKSETFAIQEESLAQATERRSQARGALLPTVSGSYNYTRQETPPGSLSSLFRSEQTTARLTAVQPLFQGLREYAGLRQANRRVEASEFGKENAKLTVFQELVQIYYQVLLLEQDLKNIQNEIKVNDQRHQDLLGFRKIGRSRQTEVLTLESNIATLEAQIEDVRSQLESARSTLAFITGESRDVSLVDDQQVPANIGSLDSYLSQINSRPDIKALEHEAEASDEGIAIARSGHFPFVDLLGNYYFKRPGSLSAVHWDVQLAVTIPLFAGGVIQSQVREAASVSKQSGLALVRARREAQSQVESLFYLIEGDLKQIEKQKKAAELSKKNYQAELRDYKLGLVTNLEVLQAMTVSQSNQRILDRAVYQLKSDYLRLQAATGKAL